MSRVREKILSGSLISTPTPSDIVELKIMSVMSVEKDSPQSLSSPHTPWHIQVSKTMNAKNVGKNLLTSVPSQHTPTHTAVLEILNAKSVEKNSLPVLILITTSSDTVAWGISSVMFVGNVTRQKVILPFTWGSTFEVACCVAKCGGGRT